MFILSQTMMAEEKANRLLQGYAAYAESTSMITLIKRAINNLHIPVIIDQAENGCWFILDQAEQASPILEQLGTSVPAIHS